MANLFEEHKKKIGITNYEFIQLQNLNIYPERPRGPKEAFAHVPSLMRFDENDEKKQDF